MNFINDNLKERATNALKVASRIAIIATAVVIGIISHDIYQRVTNPQPAEMRIRFEKPKTITETSIAINERGELMVIDRITGEYHLYQDSVGRAIFNMYAGRIYTNKIEQ